MCAFVNGSSELVLLVQNKQERGKNNKFNIMIEHMLITGRGNEISSVSPRSR